MILLLNASFTPEDLVQIEEKMHELAKKNYPVTRRVITRNEALNFFRVLVRNIKLKLLKIFLKLKC